MVLDIPTAAIINRKNKIIELPPLFA